MKIKSIYQNLVLVKPEGDYTEWGIKGADGKNLMIPLGAATKNDPYDTDKHRETREQQSQLDLAQHVSTTGIVILPPERLCYNGDLIDHYMKNEGVSIDIAAMISELRTSSSHYKTTMDLISGDKIFFKYIEQYNTVKEGRVVETNGERLLLINYDCLILALRDGEPIMLNGYILVEPILDVNEADNVASQFSKVGENGLLKPLKKELKSKKLQLGRIKFAGSICDGYLDFPKEKDDNLAQVGDIIAFEPRYGISLEHEYHREFYDKRLIRIHRKDILMVLGNEENKLDLKNFKF